MKIRTIRGRIVLAIVQQCKRVAAIGAHADPGQLLNPASKAKAAARASVKALGLVLLN
ncbi:MAG: hypothetical protein IT389_11425 [Nitrospira sp.]|nr:hypothetical protein [Nitrospira sp.]